MYFNGILQSIYCKNGTGKNPSIYLLHCYPMVYLPDISGKLKTGYEGPIIFLFNRITEVLIRVIMVVGRDDKNGGSDKL